MNTILMLERIHVSSSMATKLTAIMFHLGTLHIASQMGVSNLSERPDHISAMFEASPKTVSVQSQTLYVRLLD
jgi:hypothetical protein